MELERTAIDCLHDVFGMVLQAAAHLWQAELS